MTLFYLLILIGFILLAGWLAWHWLRAVWFSEANQKEWLARRLVGALADNVLHRAYFFSHIATRHDETVVTYARFLKPYRDGVRLATDNPADYATRNHHPGSYLKVWNSSAAAFEYLPVASVTLELDTNRLPFDTSLDTLLKKQDEIEDHALLVLREYGVVDVALQHYELKDRRHRQVRLLFKLYFRRREKGPIPQWVDWGDVVDYWGEFEFGRRQKGERHLREREKLAARLLDYAIKHFGGTFPLKKLQEVFDTEISHRQIEALGQRLEAEGVLQKVGGPHPRRVLVDQARQFIEQQRLNNSSY